MNTRYCGQDRWLNHVVDISRAFSVRLVWQDELKKPLTHQGLELDFTKGEVPELAFAMPDIRVVFGCRVREEAGYIVIMHELGHILHPTGLVRHTAHDMRSSTAGLVLLEEESAWEWAQQHALEWTVTHQRMRDWALNSYRRGGAAAAAARTRAEQAAWDTIRAAVLQGRKP